MESHDLLMPLFCHCFIGCTIPIQYAISEKVIRQRNPVTGQCVEQIKCRLGRIFHSVYAGNIYISQNMSEDAWVDFKSLVYLV